MMRRRCTVMACAAAALVSALACSEAAPEPSAGAPPRAQALLEKPWLSGLAGESDEIVRGRVLDVVAEAEGPAGEPGIFSRVRLSVEQSWLGSRTSTLEFWVEGGRLGSRARIVSLQSRFEVGEDVLVFLRHRGGFLRPTRMGLGKWMPRAGSTPDRFVPDPRVQFHLSPQAREISLTRDDLAAQPAPRLR